MTDPRARQLTIKTGIVKRLAKEKLSYEKEADQQRNRIIKLKASGSDEHVMKKEDEVLQESIMMVPDCQRRLAKAYEDLSEFLKNEVELKETKEYISAVGVMQEAQLQLP